MVTRLLLIFLALPLTAQSLVGDWEARAVLGFQQAGAELGGFPPVLLLRLPSSSAGLSSLTAADARVVLWGNIRLASMPQQSSPVLSLLAPSSVLGDQRARTNWFKAPNSLNGLELRMWRLRGQTVQRDFGFIGQYGESGPLTLNRNLQIFNLPTLGTAQFAAFQNLFGTVPPGVPYAAFANPNQNGFFKQYGAGFRVTTFDLATPSNPPATYSFTVGQDQLVTGGKYQGVVGRFDVFYPFAIGDPNFKFLYPLRHGRHTIARPPSASNGLVSPARRRAAHRSSNAYDPDRDGDYDAVSARHYRLGIGIDALSLLNKLKISLQ